MLLSNASVDEKNAAYNVVHKDLQELVAQFAPAFFRNQMLAKLEEPNTIRQVLKVIDDAITAADKVRAAKAAQQESKKE
jgi:hypothetical protein